jgi:hypothetical protein
MGGIHKVFCDSNEDNTVNQRRHTTRFAPSPNGSLHLGHAYSAIIAHDLAKDSGGRFLLRIEDIDGARSRAELADEFREDLAWSRDQAGGDRNWSRGANLSGHMQESTD